jgi:small-conductance mechanosensitive channel
MFITMAMTDRSSSFSIPHSWLFFFVVISFTCFTGMKTTYALPDVGGNAAHTFPPSPHSQDDSSSNNNDSSKTPFSHAHTPPRRTWSNVQETAALMSHHSTVMGQIKPLLQRFALTSDERLHLRQAMKEITHWEDLALLALTGWMCVPAVQMTYEKIKSHKKPFRKSLTYILARGLQQISRIALLVYCFDIIKMVCLFLHLDGMVRMHHAPHAFAQSAYTWWLAHQCSALKKHALRQYVSQHPDTFGRMQIVNRLVDAVIYAGTLLIVFSILQLEMGVAVQSFLALGSVGTLAVGLASQGITTQVLNGLMVASSDRIYEGDAVQLSNGMSGTIVKLGWLETILRGADEVIVSIPNTELVKQRVSNLSRVRYCQVKQILRFKYKEASKLPALVASIKQEIALACPQLVTDGSRPFRVHWTDYEDDYLQVIVDTHFQIKPVGDDYWNNRMRVMQAIYAAVKKHDAEFAESPVRFVNH